MRSQAAVLESLLHVNATVHARPLLQRWHWRHAATVAEANSVWHMGYASFAKNEASDRCVAKLAALPTPLVLTVLGCGVLALITRFVIVSVCRVVSGSNTRHGKLGLGHRKNIVNTSLRSSRAVAPVQPLSGDSLSAFAASTVPPYGRADTPRRATAAAKKRQI